MPADLGDQSWNNRKLYLMMLLCQILGVSTFIALPSAAVERGAAGHVAVYLAAFLVVGAPLLYMECIVGQFTARDCIRVWQIRSCLSHIGYFHVVWQIIIIIYNHIMTSFMLHYFFITFEDPIPYYICGPWATKDCNIFKYNYTINQDCIKFKSQQYKHCEHIFITFPEYQYWKYFTLAEKSNRYEIAWQVCLASAFVCIIIYASCFRRKQSLKLFLTIFTVYPMVGYVILMLGSMMQKGLVVMYEEALDTNFDIFFKKYRVSYIILRVVQSLHIGTGVSFNTSSWSGFRAPCFSTVAVAALAAALCAVLAIFTYAMMPCPYAYEYGTKPKDIIDLPMSLVFEKIPKMLKEYKYPNFWLLLSYSSNAVLGLSTNVIITFNLLEMLAVRYTIVEKYPGLTCFVGTLSIFVISTPLLGNAGIFTIFSFNKLYHFVTIFITILECFVFVIWYGVERFSEDVHFMQGIQPKSYMKIAWTLSSIVLIYVFINEIYSSCGEAGWKIGDTIGFWLLFTTIALIVLITVTKLVIAAFKKTLKESLKVNPMWGPRSGVLLRSRAMFSAQAMTKEYLYRQYHLQAGITQRQRISNVRRNLKLPSGHF